MRIERITKSTAGHLMKSLTWHVAFWLNSWIQCVIMAEQDLLKLSEKPVIQHIRMIKAALRGRSLTRVPVSELLYNTSSICSFLCFKKDFAKRSSGPPLQNFSQMEKEMLKNQTELRKMDKWNPQWYLRHQKCFVYSYIFIHFCILNYRIHLMKSIFSKPKISLLN